MNYQDLWPLIQKDILGCLAADDFTGTRKGVAIEPGDVESALDAKVNAVVSLGLDGRAGVGFLVLPIEEASDENANIPGGPLKLGIMIQWVENVILNRGPRGKQLPCRVWVAASEKILKLYTPVGFTQSLVPAAPVIHEFTPDRDANLRVGQLKFYGSEADFRPFQRLQRPQITVAGTVTVMPSGNSYQIISGQPVATVTAPGADQIFYTTDNSHPYAGNATATPYTGPVTIAGPCLFRVRAFAKCKTGSDTAAANFFI